MSNFAKYGIAGAFASLIVGVILYKHNKKVHDKLEPTVEKVKEKADKAITKAAVKTFEFTIKHPKASKAIAIGGAVGLSAGLVTLRVLRNRKVSSRGLGEQLDLLDDGTLMHGSGFSDSDWDKVKQLYKEQNQTDYDNLSEYANEKMTPHYREKYIIQDARSALEDYYGDTSGEDRPGWYVAHERDWAPELNS